MITNHALMRLMQLISPSLPVGAFTYSQGLEWAVETGWVNDADSLEQWLGDLLVTGMQDLELPVLLRMMTAWENNDSDSVQYWSDILYASRETSELRMEEKNRAAALYRLLCSFNLHDVIVYESLIKSSQAAGFSFVSTAWKIPPQQACLGYVWSWLENLVIAAVKLVPLGQTDGQKVLMQLVDKVDIVLEKAGLLADSEVGCSSPALAIASAQHETQYTRLFRS